VTVDVKLEGGDLPRGARPDLSVDGTIELEHLDNVLYVGRPAFGQPNTTISLFKVEKGGKEAVRVPVLMSSLLQLPLIASSLAASRAIAVVTANSDNLTPDFLVRNGIRVSNKLIILGLQHEPEFKSAVLEEKGSIDAALVEAEILEVARRAKEAHPNLGAVLLECSMLPPYACALQDELALPVFDFVTMIDTLYAATHQRRYEGFY
jgi:hypothetical protein